jgi:SAM-dependent methyltransferase/uncharacterized protein YbaR (Trm112 family)
LQLRLSLLDYLIEPSDGQPFRLVETEKVVHQSANGWIRCASWCGRSGQPAGEVLDTTCTQCLKEDVQEGTIVTANGKAYPIVRGIPRLLDDVCLGLVEGLSPDWVSRHRRCAALTPSEFDAKQIRTATAFGEEWRYFSAHLPDYEALARSYFDLLEEQDFSGLTLDAGCGMGRWARHAAGRGRALLAVDLSESVEVAARTLAGLPNTHVLQADVYRLPFPRGIFDLVYSLGVLHHLPDPQEGLKRVAWHLKEGRRFLGYFYYAFDNRPGFYRVLIPVVSALRWIISRFPRQLARVVCLFIAIFVYWPLIQLGRLLNAMGFREAARHVPLYEFYGGKRFSIIFNDSVDRFATAIEFRFSREQLRETFSRAGLGEVRFSETAPFWKVVGSRRLLREPLTEGLAGSSRCDETGAQVQTVGGPIGQAS